MFTGRIHTMELNIEPSVFESSLRKWESGTLLQDAFPTLSPDEREFVKTGVTPEEWENSFGGLE
jgi:hypothetical protein